MAHKKGTVTYTEEELETLRVAGKSETDWERVDATTEAELEAAIVADPDEELDEFTGTAFAGLQLPPRKKYINIGVDEDVVTWFKSVGRGYQTRMNAVLRKFYREHRDQDDARQ